MKNLLFIIGCCFIANVATAQTVKDEKGSVIAYITRGTISDKNNTLRYTFNDDGRIVDQQANTRGFLVVAREYFEIQDKERKTVGFVLADGTLQDSDRKSIGSIFHTTGPVILNGNVIATLDAVETYWAGAYFLLLKS